MKMNNLLPHTIQLVSALMLIAILSSCGNDFLNTKPQDTVSIKNFYKNNSQVEASTNILYGSVWFFFNNKFQWAVGDLRAGNVRTYSSDVVAFGNFTLTPRGQGGSSNTVLSNGWGSLYTVIAQANTIINSLPDNVGAQVDEATMNQALGEAHIMRALAYFYLARIWGPVPIILNASNHIAQSQVPRYKVADIYQLIKNDLNFGISHCRNISSGLYNEGHVTVGSAKALLSKVYLTRGDFQKAQELSQEVIDSGEFKLLPNYGNIFKTQNNNNIETIIALQWEGSAGYGHANGNEAFFAYTPELTGTGTGYGEIGPSIDFQNQYEQGDKRIKPTIMLPGFHYPELLQSDGGFTVPDDVNEAGTHAATKKYVVGTPDDPGGAGQQQSRNNNTYLLRYADVLLINAEAAFRNGDTPQALQSINKVRERAGLTDYTSLTLDDILKERRIELAYESKYWYDLKRIDRQKAIQIINNQERGHYNDATSDDITSQMYTITDDKFLLSYPETEVALNPFFNKPPQSFDFGNDNNNNNSTE